MATRCLALSLIATAVSASVGLPGSWDQRRFSRPDVCPPAAATGAALGNASWPAGLSECAVECGRADWCAALLHQLGVCYALDWTLYFTMWLGGGGPCPEKFFAAEHVYQQLNFVSCQQTDVTFAAPCQRAMDGNSNQDFGAGSCTHTGTSSSEWWLAQLLQPAFVAFVAIYNRQDCCSDRLNNFTVRVDGGECVRYNEPSPFSVRNFTCGRVGQTMRIDLGQLSSLTLCEVVPYGRYLN